MSSAFDLNEIFFHAISTFSLNLSHNRCLKWILPQDGLRGPLAWAFQRDSEFVELFNYHFQKMDEGGLLNQLQKTIYNKETHEDKCNVQMITIGYENVAFPCLVLITGLIVALLYSMAEWQWVWMKKKLANKPGKGGWLEDL